MSQSWWLIRILLSIIWVGTWTSSLDIDPRAGDGFNKSPRLVRSVCVLRLATDPVSQGVQVGHGMVLG